MRRRKREGALASRCLFEPNPRVAVNGSRLIRKYKCPLSCNSKLDSAHFKKPAAQFTLAHCPFAPCLQACHLGLD